MSDKDDGLNAESRKRMLHSKEFVAVDGNSDSQFSIFAQLRQMLDERLSRGARNKLRTAYEQETSDVEKRVMQDILSHIDDPEVLVHFLCGAHIEFRDEAGNTDSMQYYTKWQEENKKLHWYMERHSSHKSTNQQVGLNGKILGHILIGTRTDPQSGQSYTWVQLENNPSGTLRQLILSPVRFLLQSLLHLLDYIKYKVSGKNIGPHGRSDYTEKNPLKLGCSPREERAKVWEELLLKESTDFTESDVYKMQQAGIKIKPTPQENRLSI